MSLFIGASESYDTDAWETYNFKKENARLRKYVAWLEKWALDHAGFGMGAEVQFELDMKRRELGVGVDAYDRDR